MANKVKYGLKNVYYALTTIAADGTATFGTPKPWPGAVSLNLEAQGGTNKFRADNINYFISQANNGYEGDLECALIPESFRVDVMGEIIDGNGVMLEDVEAKTVNFALLFQFEGDDKAVRHVLYNCTASRPSIASATTEEEIEPQTETITITSSSVYWPDINGGKNLAHGRSFQGEASYAGWFGMVYAPSSTSNVLSVTQTLTKCVSSWSAPSIQSGADFVAKYTPNSTYSMSSVTVTMGGESVSGAYNEDTGFVTVPNVSGALVITATAS